MHWTRWSAELGKARRWLWEHHRATILNAILLIAAGLGLSAFWELAEELSQGTLLPIDLIILKLIRPLRTTGLDVAAHFLSDLPTPPWVLLLVAPFLAYLLLTRRYRHALWLLATPTCTVVLVELLKLIFQRDRPLTAVIEEIGYSFPSGHATGATVLYGSLAFIAWRYWVRTIWSRAVVVAVGGLLIMGTGLARVYLEVHFLSDVLAGWSAGLCILAGAIMLIRWLANEPLAPKTAVET